MLHLLGIAVTPAEPRDLVATLIADGSPEANAADEMSDRDLYAIARSSYVCFTLASTICARS